MNIDEWNYRSKHKRCATCTYLTKVPDGDDWLGNKSYYWLCRLKNKTIYYPMSSRRGMFCRYYSCSKDMTVWWCYWNN